MDMFETRTMLEAVHIGPKATSFLRDVFFSKVKEFDTAVIDIDLKRNGQTAAPYIGKSQAGKMIAGSGHISKTFRVPEVGPLKQTTAGDVLTRQAGEAPYTNQSAQARAYAILGEDLAELDEMVTRREEAQCAEALAKGRVTVKGDGIDEVVDYWPADNAQKPYLELAGDAKWGGSAANITANVRTAKQKTAKDGVTTNVAVLGADAANLFLADEKVQKLLDNRRIDTGVIKPEDLENGAEYLGRCLGVDFYTYVAEYIDPVDGALKSYVPTDYAIFGSTKAATTMAYGAVAAVVDDKMVVVAERRVPQSWVERNPVARNVQMKAAPLAIINQPNGFYVIKVK